MAVNGRPAGMVRDALRRIWRGARDLTSGQVPDLPDVSLLGERAAIAGLTRRAPLSCGGAFRLLRTADGWCGLSLARPSDRDLVPALVERAGHDPWAAVTAWAARISSADVEARFRLLGLPGSAVRPAPTAGRDGVVRVPGGRRDSVAERPLVVDFSALWAGPLCTHLLGLCGAEVVKVETADRPDGARRGPQSFYDLLHHGQRSVTIDPTRPRDRVALRRLVARADLVVEASRPRALLSMGLDAGEAVDEGTTWLSITARGRDVDAVGFGDDVAAGAGLLAEVGGRPVPAGDALADPLAGVVAAAEALEALLEPRARLIDLSMHDVARTAVTGTPAHEVSLRQGGSWWVSTNSGEAAVAPPRARIPRGRAAAMGADNLWLVR